MAASAGVVAGAMLMAAAVWAAGGHLDRSFGNDGKIRTGFGQPDCGPRRALCDDQARAVAIAPRGRIVAAGFAGGRQADLAVALYRRDGALDGSFSGNGKARTDLGGNDRAHDVAVDSQGRIVVAGFSRLGGGDNGAVIARYLPDGSLDLSFGQEGTVASGFGIHIAIDSQDRILATGGLDGGFGVIRLQADGAPDPTFGSGGIVRTSFPAAAAPSCVAVDSQGRIVLAGVTLSARGPRSFDFALARYLPDGTLDRGFSGDGRSITDFRKSARLNAAAIDSRDRVVVAGNAHTGKGIQFALARYRRDGGLDPSFGPNGVVRTDFGDSDAGATSVAIDSRKRIVAAGGPFLLARYGRDGRLDRSFSRDGMVRTKAPRFKLAQSVAVDSRDRIVAGGYGVFGRSGHRDASFALARYVGYGRH